MKSFWKKDGGFTLTELLGLIIGLILIVGEVKCVVKAFNCDWEAPYKSEAIYTISAITGIGGIVGYMNFEDGK